MSSIKVAIKVPSLHEVVKTLMQNTDNKNFAFILSNLYIQQCNYTIPEYNDQTF